MIDIEELNDKIMLIIGLANALKKTAWQLQDIPTQYRADFNSILAVVDCLEIGLNQMYGMVKAEV